MQSTSDSNKRKLLDIISHASIFISALVLSAGIPLAIWLVSDDSVIKDNAKEALNFHFNVWLYGIIFGVLTWVLIGWPLLALLFLAQIILPIMAILSCLQSPDTVYRYPFIFRIL